MVQREVLGEAELSGNNGEIWENTKHCNNSQKCPTPSLRVGILSENMVKYQEIMCPVPLHIQTTHAAERNLHLLSIIKSP